ncbi:MAG: DUF2480 family protein [Taibaiella sp.]|nr:DUF2480 family protein [Taibaiella sp.]
MEQFVNKVAESGIITLDLANYIPADDAVAAFDLKPYLFREMILKEKDNRAQLLTTDWQQFENKHTALFCSVDAIIPVWAYMLACTLLQPVAASVYFGTVAELKKHLVITGIQGIDVAEYADKRVVIKGCGDTPIPEAAYVTVTAQLRPVVKSLMYGEPCSTVPVYKKPAPPRAV